MGAIRTSVSQFKKVFFFRRWSLGKTSHDQPYNDWFLPNSKIASQDTIFFLAISKTVPWIEISIFSLYFVTINYAANDAITLNFCARVHWVQLIANLLSLENGIRNNASDCHCFLSALNHWFLLISMDFIYISIDSQITAKEKHRMRKYIQFI